MHFDDQELPAVKLTVGLVCEESREGKHHRGDDLGMIVQLESDDALMSRGGIGYDVCKITVEGRRMASSRCAWAMTSESGARIGRTSRHKVTACPSLFRASDISVGTH